MRFEAGNVSSLLTATVNAPLAALRAPVTEVMRLRELGITITAATAFRVGLARAAVVSGTPATTVAGQNRRKGAPASGSLLVSSWTTAPTVTAPLFKRISLPGTIGAGVIWTWPDDPLEVGDGAAISELLILNLVAVAPPIFEYYAIWED